MNQAVVSQPTSANRSVTAISTKEAVIQASELYRSGGQVLRRVAINKERLVVERDGYPVAVIVPYEQQQSTQADPLRDVVIKLGREAERQGLTEEQLMAELEQSKHRVFEQHYGRIEKYQPGTRKKTA